MSLHDAIAELKKAPTVNIKGKTYTTVSTRLEVFRNHFPSYGILTKIEHADAQFVRAQATICNEQGQPVAMGHSEEYRQANAINKTSAVENAETSAIGRALAAFGLHGGEYATADEVRDAIDQQRATPTKTQIEPMAHAIVRDLKAAEDADDAAMFYGVLETYSDALEYMPKAWPAAWQGAKGHEGMHDRIERLRKHFDALTEPQQPTPVDTLVP